MKCYQVYEQGIDLIHANFSALIYIIYFQGPCKNNEILVLPPKKASPECKRNNCPRNKVSFKGKCVNLNGSEGCPKHLFVQIDSSSLQLNCTFELGTRFTEPEITSNLVDGIGAICLLGGKRTQNETCNPV